MNADIVVGRVRPRVTTDGEAPRRMDRCHCYLSLPLAVTCRSFCSLSSSHSASARTTSRRPPRARDSSPSADATCRMNALGRVAARSVLVSSVSRVSRASSSRVGSLRRATTTARRGVAAAMASADDVPSFVGRWTRASEGEPPRARPIDRATRRVRVRVATTAIVLRPRGRARPASRLRPHPNPEKIRSLPSSSSSSTQRASTRPRTSPRTASPPRKPPNARSRRTSKSGERRARKRASSASLPTRARARASDRSSTRSASGRSRLKAAASCSAKRAAACSETRRTRTTRARAGRCTSRRASRRWGGRRRSGRWRTRTR